MLQKGDDIQLLSADELRQKQNCDLRMRKKNHDTIFFAYRPLLAGIIETKKDNSANVVNSGENNYSIHRFCEFFSLTIVNTL